MAWVERLYCSSLRADDVVFGIRFQAAITGTGTQAVAATAQFTLGMRHRTYVGGELETGALDSRGSSTAGVYGVFGVDLPFAAGALGAELASGWRSVRYSTDTDDISNLVVEPRLRASVWLSEQTTLSVTGGMTLDDRPVFMAGVSIGIHSNDFGAWKK